jgi:hypothetical protein
MFALWRQLCVGGGVAFLLFYLSLPLLLPKDRWAELGFLQILFPFFVPLYCFWVVAITVNAAVDLCLKRYTTGKKWLVLEASLVTLLVLALLFP